MSDNVAVRRALVERCLQLLLLVEVVSDCQENKEEAREALKELRSVLGKREEVP